MAQKVPPISVRLNYNKGCSVVSYADAFESHLFFKHFSLIKCVTKFYTRFLKYKKNSFLFLKKKKKKKRYIRLFELSTMVLGSTPYKVKNYTTLHHSPFYTGLYVYNLLQPPKNFVKNVKRGLRRKYRNNVKSSLRRKYRSNVKRGLRRKYKNNVKSGLKRKYGNKTKF